MHRGPLVGMDGRPLAGADARVEDANAIGLEQEAVLVGRGDERVEIGQGALCGGWSTNNGDRVPDGQATAVPSGCVQGARISRPTSNPWAVAASTIR